MSKKKDERILRIDKPFILKFIRFCVVGAISFVIGMGWTWLFYEFIKWDLIIATILAIILTQIFQFPMSKEWAFKYRHRAKIVQFLFFLGSRFGSYVLVTLMTWIGPTYFNLHWIISQLAGVVLGTVFNFIVANWFVFVEPVITDEPVTPVAPTDTLVETEDKI